MVAQQLGHSRVETSAIYARVCPEIIQSGMDKMEKLAALAMKGPAVAQPVSPA